MMQFLKKHIKPPYLETRDKNKLRISLLLNTLNWIVLLLSVSGLISLLFIYHFQPAQLSILGPFLAFSVGLFFGVRWMMAKGRDALGSWLLIIFLGGLLTAGVFYSGSPRVPVYAGFINLVLMAGLLIDRRASFLTATAAFLVGLVLLLAELNGMLPPLRSGPIGGWVINILLIFSTFLLVSLSSKGMDEAMLRALQENEERQRIETALRESEEKFRTIVESLPVGIQLFQMDDQDRLTLVLSNPTANQILHIEQSDAFLGMPLESLVPASMEGDIIQRYYETATMGEPTRMESYRAAEGVVLSAIDSRAFQLSAGKIVIVFQNIRERKQNEMDREKLITDLEAKNAELERFTYTVSHDLKSPLITIRGFLGFLAKDAQEGNIERLNSDIGRITEAARKMQRLLDELLELSRIGRIIHAPQTLPFDAVVKDALEAVSGQIEARQVRVEIQEGLPLVWGDRARLMEVVQNLVDNAVKFLGDQADPLICIGTAGTDADGKSILFVQDNGMGIEPRYQERIFGLFNKLDAKTDGTGVGLTLVKRIIEVHNGRIWVVSDGKNHGSVFYFTLPNPTPEPVI